MSYTSAELSYVSEVASRSPVLEQQHELELARRVRDFGDRAAADALVRAHLRLVIATALKYRRYGIPVSELVAEGNCGLVTALRKFDPERGTRFATYARHWVRAHVLACVIRSANVLGGGSAPIRPQLFFKLRRERARITAILGEGAVADRALAQRMNMSFERLQRLLGRLDCRSVPLDSTAGGELIERETGTLISADNPEERYFRGRRHEIASSAVASALGILDARERFIAENRILAASEDELSLEEIAKTWGISRERVRQLEERAKQKLGRSTALRQNAILSDWLSH